MTCAGWITIPNWRTFQHYHDGRQPEWIKVYAELLDNDAYLALSLADRGLLHGIWLLISRSGNGRLTCDRVSLSRKLNVRRVSLEPLIQAGFITIESRRSDRPSLAQSKREKEGGTTSLLPKERDASSAEALHRVNGGGSKRRRQVAQCRHLFNGMIADGDTRLVAIDALTETFKHDPSILTDAIPQEEAHA